MTRLWILGAADPEMQAIEALLRECGETVGYATDDVGCRVTPRNMYRATHVDTPDSDPVDAAAHECYLVECAVADVAGKVLDHHRPGDPGYGRPPSEFLAASSIGQVIAELARMWNLRRRWDGVRYRGLGWDGSVEDGIGEGLTEGEYRYGRWGTHTDGIDGLEYGTAHDAEGPDWVVGAPWGNHTGVVIPLDLVYVAAADHCLGAAYRGECPGVDPDALRLGHCHSERKGY